MTKSIDIDMQSAPTDGGADTRGSLLDARFIAGIAVPHAPLIDDVVAYAQRLYQPYLFNHAMRSWLFAAKLGQLKGLTCDLEVVAVGTILHDIGLAADVPGSNRFEI